MNVGGRVKTQKTIEVKLKKSRVSMQTPKKNVADSVRRKSELNTGSNENAPISPLKQRLITQYTSPRKTAELNTSRPKVKCGSSKKSFIVVKDIIDLTYDEDKLSPNVSRVNSESSNESVRYSKKIQLSPGKFFKKKDIPDQLIAGGSQTQRSPVKYNGRGKFNYKKRVKRNLLRTESESNKVCHEKLDASVRTELSFANDVDWSEEMEIEPDITFSNEIAEIEMKEKIENKEIIPTALLDQDMLEQFDNTEQNWRQPQGVETAITSSYTLSGYANLSSKLQNDASDDINPHNDNVLSSPSIRSTDLFADRTNRCDDNAEQKIEIAKKTKLVQESQLNCLSDNNVHLTNESSSSVNIILPNNSTPQKREGTNGFKSEGVVSTLKKFDIDVPTHFDPYVYYLLGNPMSELALKEGILAEEKCLEFGSQFNKLSCDGQKLYGHLFSRKPDWFRVQIDLVEKYSDKLRDVPGLVHSLINCGFLCSDYSKEPLENVLSMLHLKELKEICKSLKIDQKGKKYMINALLRHSKQTTLSNMPLHQLILNRVSEVLGECVSLIPSMREVFSILLTLATYPYHKDEKLDRLNELKRRLSGLRFKTIAYPPYRAQAVTVFPSFSHLQQYSQALIFSAELSEKITKKKWTEAESMVLEAKKRFERLPESESWVNPKRHLAKFCSGSVLAYCLYQGINVLKRNKSYDEAKQVISLLVSQKIFMSRKLPLLCNELACIHQLRFKDISAAGKAVCAGLEMDSLTPIQAYMLGVRAEALLKKPGLNEDLRNRLLALIPKKKFRPTELFIPLIGLEGERSKKQMFSTKLGDDTIHSSIEEAVILHFEYEAQPSYSKGMHDEGRTLMNLILACFYDVIYGECEDGESMFHCQMQTEPLDWGSRCFYSRRKTSIENVLREITLGGTNAIWEKIANTVDTEGMNCVVDWNRLTSEDLPKLMELVSCLGVEVFSKMAQLLISDYRTYRSGFPDLTLWDPPTNKCLFVEVKGPNDHLSAAQIIWLQNLHQFGANAVVCHVEMPGSTKRRSSAKQEKM